VREVRAKSRHLFADVRARGDADDLLRDQIRVGGEIDRQLLHACREARLQFQAALVSGLGDFLDHAAQQ